MTIGKKIIGGYLIVLTILIIVCAATFYTFRTIEGAYAEFLDSNTQAILIATALKLEARDQTAQYRGALIYAEEQNRLIDDTRESHRQFDALVEKLRTLSRLETARRILQGIEEIQKSHKAAQEQVIALLQRGKREEAITLSSKEALPLALKLRDKCDQYIEFEQKNLAQGRGELSNTIGRASFLLIIVSVLGVITGLAIGVQLTRSITRQLREAISQLSTSSSEIVAMTTQVASGATETAAAVSETTTTVEEVKQTSQVASQKAKYVSDAAQRSATDRSKDAAPASRSSARAHTASSR